MLKLQVRYVLQICSVVCILKICSTFYLDHYTFITMWTFRVKFRFLNSSEECARTWLCGRASPSPQSPATLGLSYTAKSFVLMWGHLGSHVQVQLRQKTPFCHPLATPSWNLLCLVILLSASSPLCSLTYPSS